jgi:hypothetical protein
MNPPSVVGISMGRYSCLKHHSVNMETPRSGPDRGSQQE